MPKSGEHYAERVWANGAGWAARLGLDADDDFWQRWEALDKDCQLLDPPVKDGRRCGFGCKRRVYFLTDNSRTCEENCDGVCDPKAKKLLRKFGFDRRANSGEKKERGGQRAAKGAKAGSMALTALKKGQATGLAAKGAPVPSTRRCRRTDGAWRCDKARRLGGDYCSERCRRLAEDPRPAGPPAPASPRAAAAARHAGVVDRVVDGRYGFAARRRPASTV